MLYLNNELLTSDRIISYFDKNIVQQKQPTAPNTPSPLTQLKNKLKANFFPKIMGFTMQLLETTDDPIDVTQLPKTYPILIKQKIKTPPERYLLYRHAGQRNLRSA